ncbi:hypothetical protein EG68_10879 [Paragonimus skrjabini miyazakii]|uniref:Uncharacterized protein n=1 Tax=Paragonimus skrjabini miyazakii TaxID=59628 RepID=A0A8S9YF36_9TREM|nr:hypothetical protein EG68_10879 [Paragonimus skrjabini miyazakii]
MKVDKAMTAFYRPEENEPVECTNRTLEGSILALVYEVHQGDETLPQRLLAYRVFVCPFINKYRPSNGLEGSLDVRRVHGHFISELGAGHSPAPPHYHKSETGSPAFKRSSTTSKGLL